MHIAQLDSPAKKTQPDSQTSSLRDKNSLALRRSTWYTTIHLSSYLLLPGDLSRQPTDILAFFSPSLVCRGNLESAHVSRTCTEHNEKKREKEGRDQREKLPFTPTTREVQSSAQGDTSPVELHLESLGVHPSIHIKEKTREESSPIQHPEQKSDSRRPLLIVEADRSALQNIPLSACM